MWLGCGLCGKLGILVGGWALGAGNLRATCWHRIWDRKLAGNLRATCGHTLGLQALALPSKTLKLGEFAWKCQ